MPIYRIFWGKALFIFLIIAIGTIALNSIRQYIFPVLDFFREYLYITIFSALSALTVIFFVFKKQSLLSLAKEKQIREHEKLQAALEESFSALHTTLESIAEGILVINNEGSIIRFNQKFINLWHIPFEIHEKNDTALILNHIHSQLFNAQDFIVQLHEASFKAKQTEPDQIKLKDGRIFECSSQPQELNGKILGRVWSFKDISKSILFQATREAMYEISEAVHNSKSINNLYKIIHTIIGKLMPSKNFYIAIFNEASNLLTFPYFVDEYDTVPPPQKPGNGLTEYVFKNGKALLVEKVLDEELRKKGEVEMIGSPSAVWLGTPLIAGDKVFGVMVVQDYDNPEAFNEIHKEILTFISEQIAMAIQRKSIEDELVLQRSLLQKLLDTVPDTIYFKDLDSLFILANKACAKRFGVQEQSELHHRSDFDFYNPKHAIITYNDEQRIIKTGKPIINKEEKEIWPSGDFSWVSTTKMPLYNEEGRIIGTFGVSRDITENKENEQKIQEYAEQLRVANINKDKLYSVIAHDLRSPFHPLLAYSELLATEIETLSTDEIQEYGITIHKLLKNQFDLLENLLNWTKMQSNRMDFQPIKLDVWAASGKVINLLLASAVKKKITIKNRTGKECYVLADQNMLSSILQNLLSNAIKFTEPGGEITIVSEQLNNFIRITVADNGVGIAPDDLNKIFAMDSQLSTMGTDQEKGSGLGLLLCKDMITKHGGTIEVESEVGKGSSFIFTLPEIGNQAS